MIADHALSTVSRSVQYGFTGRLVELRSVEVFERAGPYGNEGILAKGWITCIPMSHES